MTKEDTTSREKKSLIFPTIGKSKNKRPEINETKRMATRSAGVMEATTEGKTKPKA